MNQEDYLQNLLAFLSASPTAFHATAGARRLLDSQGFRRLLESEDWGDPGPGAYYVTRNDSALIAFVLNQGAGGCRSLRMAGAHTDSPGFRLKPNTLHSSEGHVRLGVEVYGGPLLSTWFDRDCSLAGRVIWLDRAGQLRASLVDFKRPLAVIPSLAAHLDPTANKEHTINRQTDLVPLLTLGEAPDFAALLLDRLREDQTDPTEILGFDLFLYDAQPPARVGLNGELLCAARLDNLLSCHALVQALSRSADCQDALIVLNDHEEVGSASAAGARGSFLRDVLQRLFTPARLAGLMARSLLVSADNAHALHPNFVGKHEPEHQPRMQGGPVVKVNAGQCYATSAATAAQFAFLCRQAGVPCQSFVMRNDMACGSTIGPVTASELGVATVDVGVPQLAMHSVRETAAWLDGYALLQVMRAFFAADERLLCAPQVDL